MLPAPPAYQDAIALTTRTIGARARRYRQLAVAVLGLGAACALGAALRHSWLPLSGVLAVVPVAAAYFWFDARLVAGWRRGVLDLWAEERLDVATFVAAARAVPGLPQRTRDAMLVTLPPPDASGLIARARPVVALTVEAIDARARDHALAVALARTVVLVAAVAAVVRRFSWLPLVPLLGVPLILVVERAIGVWRLRRAARALAAYRSTVGETQGVDVPDWLDWGGVPARWRRRFITAAVAAAPEP